MQVMSASDCVQFAGICEDHPEVFTGEDQVRARGANGVRSGATKRCENPGEERSDQLTRTRALGNTTYNGYFLRSSLYLSAHAANAPYITSLYSP